MEYQDLIDLTNHLQQEAFRICEQFQFREIEPDEKMPLTYEDFAAEKLRGLWEYQPESQSWRRVRDV